MLVSNFILKNVYTKEKLVFCFFVCLLKIFGEKECCMQVTCVCVCVADLFIADTLLQCSTGSTV